MSMTLVFLLVLVAPPKSDAYQHTRRLWSSVQRRKGSIHSAWVGIPRINPPATHETDASSGTTDATSHHEPTRSRSSLIPSSGLLASRASKKDVLAFMKLIRWGGIRTVKLWGRQRQQYYVTKDLSGTRCIALLTRLGIDVEPAKPKGFISTAIRLKKPFINGIRLTWYWGRGYDYVIDCRLALSIYMAAPIIRKYGFDELLFTSMYRHTKVRGTRHWSRHAYGMAIDVRALRGPGGLIGVIERDWIRVKGTPEDCVGPVPPGIARTMRAMVCELETMPIFRRILSPDNDHGHRDHLHMAAPFTGETWFRRRYAGHVYGRPMPTYRHKPHLTYPVPPRPKDMKP